MRALARRTRVYSFSGFFWILITALVWYTVDALNQIKVNDALFRQELRIHMTETQSSIQRLNDNFDYMNHEAYANKKEEK